MGISIGAVADGEMRRWRDVVETAFGEDGRESDLVDFKRIVEQDRIIAARDAEAIVGAGAAFTFDLTVPGGMTKAAAVTAIAVLPTHRRRGILTAMMRHQLDDVRARGESLAILFASEGGIYQRYGYGMATLASWFEVARDRTAYRDKREPEGRVRLIGVDEATRAYPPIFERMRPEYPGFFGRSEAWWDTEVLSDPEHWRRGGGKKQYGLYETADGAEGYVIYRFHGDWDMRGPKTSLSVRELMGATPRAVRDLWRYIFDIDLVATIRTQLQPSDHPLLTLLAEPRRLGLTLADGLWVRVVDVAGALQGRAYRGDGEVTFEVRDEFCPWNAGAWRMAVANGVARVERGSGEPEMALDAADLGAVYLSGFRFNDLVRSGRVRELSHGAVARADALFAIDRDPWCPQIF